LTDYTPKIIPPDPGNPTEAAVTWQASKADDDGHGVTREPLITWIASYPKSGSTWLRAFLAAYKTGSDVDINALGMVGGDDLNPMHYQNVVGKPWKELTQFEAMATRGAALLQLMHTYASLTPLFVKTHSFVGQLAEFPTIPVGMTRAAVYIIRDPRDIVSSLARHNRDSIDETIKQMGHPRMPITRESLFHVIGSWSLNVESWSSPSASELNVHVMRYEDLLRQPIAYFEKMLAHVCWRPDAARLEHAISASCFTELQTQEVANGFRERLGDEPFFHTGREGAWRDVLTEGQISRIEGDHGKTMLKFGYKLETRKVS